MPKRSLAARRIWLEEPRAKNSIPQTIAPSDIDGRSLIDIFCDWCSDPKMIAQAEKGSDDCIRVNSVQRLSTGALLVDTNSGKRGEKGELYGFSQSKPLFHISESDAPTGHTRNILFIPQRGESALFFSEYCMRGTSGTQLIRGFTRYVSQVLSKRLSSEFLLESDEWLDNIRSVRNIEFRVHKLPSKSYEALQTTKGSVSIEMRPARGSSFDGSVIDKLRNRVDIANSLIGLQELDGEPTRVFATVRGADGRDKKVDLQDIEAPRFYRTLSERDQPELTDDQFIQTCSDYAGMLFSRLGIDWMWT